MSITEKAEAIETAKPAKTTKVEKAGKSGGFRKFTTRDLVTIAMLAALSTVAYYLIEVPIIPFAPHLKVNFADIPALLGGIVIAPIASVPIILIRCLIHLFKTDTAGIGELIDFMIGVGFVYPAAFLFTKLRAKGKHGISASYVISSVSAVIACIVVGLLSNLALYPVFMYLILGVGIESPEVFMTYLVGTILTNLVRSSTTVIATAVFIPFIARFKKTVYRTA